MSAIVCYCYERGGMFMHKFYLKAVVVSLICFVALIGCKSSSDDDPVNPEQSQITSMVWETTGGGDMKFKVEEGSAGYMITVERHDFHAVDIAVPLTSSNPDVLNLVKGIFEGQTDLNDYTFVPQGQTGTWTSITLIDVDDHETKINNIDPTGWLKILYDFVDNAYRNP
jgi:hypothetical protein